MAYRHNDALHKHQKRAGRLKKVAVVFSIFLFLAVSAIGIDWIINQINNTETVVSSENTKSVQAANVSVFRTPYFQFQATEDWILVADQSSDNKFTYVKNSGRFVSQRIVFYIDQPIEDRVDQNIAKLIPVEISANNDFIPGSSVSEHCDTQWPEGLARNPSRIVYDNIEIECTPNTQEYNVIAGNIGGSDRIPITLKNGDQHTLTIVYSDLTAYPSPGDIYNLIATLKIL